MITLKGFAARLCFTTLLAFAVINGSAADSAAEPEPPIVKPGKDGTAPSDAIILFDGKDLSAWKSGDGGAARWKVENGVMVTNGGHILTKEEFGAVQLHIEWATPAEVTGKATRAASCVNLKNRHPFQRDALEQAGQRGIAMGFWHPPTLTD